MRISARLYLLIVFVAFCSAVAHAEVLDRIVATVNGDIILNSELQERLRAVVKASPELGTSDPAQRERLEREVLNQMVRERLTQAEVKRLKITVSQRDMDDAMAQIKKDNNVTDAQLEYMVQQEGQSFAQFKDGIRKELERGLLLDRLLKSKTVITEAQIDAYLKTGKSDSGERRRIAIIFVPNSGEKVGKQNEDAEKLARDIHRRLKEGADFAKMAKEYSKGPAAAEGGDLGYINSDELASVVAAATRGLKPNEITDPISSPAGYSIIKVMDIQKENQSTVDAGAREKARRQLFQQEVNRKFEEWIRDLTARAFIQISL